MSDIILKAEHLVKTYGSGETAVKALDDVSLEVSKGEFVAIVDRAEAENPHFSICWAQWIIPIRALSQLTARTFFP